MRHYGLGIATLPITSRCWHARVPPPSRAHPYAQPRAQFLFHIATRRITAQRLSRTQRGRISAPASVGCNRLLASAPFFKTLSRSCVSVLDFMRRTRSLNRIVLCNAPRPYSWRSHFVALLTLGYAKLVPLVCQFACTMSRCKPRAPVS
jgi:hypothetical protein